MKLLYYSTNILVVNQYLGVKVMVFDATFYNSSIMSWRSVVLVVDTRENHRPAAIHLQTLSLNVV
jgi:hypothetical protein